MGDPNMADGPVPPASGGVDKDARTMAMLAHLLGAFPCLTLIGPLIIWLLKKDQSPFVDSQGKEAVNFGITMLIAQVVTITVGSLTCFLIFLPAIVSLVQIILGIMAAVQANNGVDYRYPFNIRLVK